MKLSKAVYPTATVPRFLRAMSIMALSQGNYLDRSTRNRSQRGVYENHDLIIRPKLSTGLIVSHLALEKNAEESNISHGLGMRMRISNQSPDVEKPHTFRCCRSKLEAAIDETDAVEWAGE